MKTAGGWRCPSCGRRVYDMADHLPRCPALGRPRR
jgi:tRNA(Ile2) C34 agmatinyltransferase TiaS